MSTMTAQQHPEIHCHSMVEKWPTKSNQNQGVPVYLQGTILYVVCWYPHLYVALNISICQMDKHKHQNFDGIPKDPEIIPVKHLWNIKDNPCLSVNLCLLESS
ncbi:hypothetical protein CHARACLAT_014629 [Characodon lateralis]|uniref:Uncharacterized protein n=1 Tax=Characodon lateralis TaxID=208331 RepID=A0ABU7EB12_9TELE|nr:hypothetical protein [Characodon lateralis]